MIMQAHLPRHGGVTLTTKGLRHLFWPGKQKDVVEFVAGCACVSGKEGRPPKNKALASVRAEAPMDLFAADVFCYDDKEYLTMMDIYSGMPFIRILPNGHTQQEVLEKYTSVISEIGEPKWVLSDRGPEFDTIPQRDRTLTAADHGQTD